MGIRQVHLWLRQEQIRLPVVEIDEHGQRIVWKLPVYSSVLRILTNPIYAGAVRPELPEAHHTWVLAA